MRDKVKGLFMMAALWLAVGGLVAGTAQGQGGPPTPPDLTVYDSTCTGESVAMTIQ